MRYSSFILIQYFAWHNTIVSKKYEKKKNPHQAQNPFYVASLLNPEPPTKTNTTIKTCSVMLFVFQTKQVETVSQHN